MYSFKEIAQKLTHIFIQSLSPEAEIRHLLIDSRKLAFATQGLFFALKGERHNGHHYLLEVYQQGVRNFIISEVNPELLAQMPEANILQVSDTQQALQKLATLHRNQFTYPVLAITGSNGKTIVKEWLSHLLAGQFRVIKSPKSFNSQVGVPLSLWEMQDWYNVGVFEAGISQKGEMQKLQEMIQPQYGIFTNLGTAHDEGFTNRKEKLKEKIQLFKDCKVVFYKKGNPELDTFLAENPPSKTKWMAWQEATIENTNSPDKELTLIQYSPKNTQQTTLHILGSSPKNFLLPFSTEDYASLENITHSLLASLYLEVKEDILQVRLSSLRAVEMRLSLKTGYHQCMLIDDSYNNDLAGLQIALDFLMAQTQHSQQIVILSEVMESGLPEEILYERIASLLSEKKLTHLIGIGSAFSRFKDFFTLKSDFFESTEDFLASQLWQNFREASILVKGARKFTFEKIIQKLEKQSHGTVLEINLEALVHNLNFYRSILSPKTKLMVMVKAFAYGSGLGQVANLLQFHRVDYLAVAYADEGVALRENGIHLPIMVMNPGEGTWEKIFRYDLEPEIYSFRVLAQYLEAYQEFVEEPHKTHRIHLKIDTGMHRLGFEEDDSDSLLHELEQKLPYHVQVVSVFSHLAGADEAKHEAFSKNQIATFQRFAQKLEDSLGYTFIKHILNSPGIVRFPEAQLDMVRLGIGLYGIEANAEQQAKLMPIGTLKTNISQIKHVQKGESIGYGRWGIAKEDTRIATIAIGYADGFSRQLSRGIGQVWIQGQAVPVIGNVCMDMTMVELGNIPAKEGDEVIIFSPEHSIIEMAQKLKTIPYEILTSISERVKRVFYS
jgi:alanine racemase